MDILPRSFVGKISVKKPKLLRCGLPYIYHTAYQYKYSFKTIHDDNNGKNINSISVSKQNEIYNKLISKVITKPLTIAIGSYPTEKGCNAIAASLLYHMDDNNKDFNIIVVSSLFHSPQRINNLYSEMVPEVVCIMDLMEESVISIENARAIMSAYRNSILIVPVATKNILKFFKYRLHKTGLYLQFSNLTMIKEI